VVVSGPRKPFRLCSTTTESTKYVLAFLSIGSRRIEYFGGTSTPGTAWMLSHPHTRPGAKRERPNGALHRQRPLRMP
jgi:hypothetical protein